MKNIEKYVEQVNEYFKAHPDLTETEKIMYVYLDLGLKFKFDQDFFFAGSKKKANMYRNASQFNELEECMEKNKIICKSASYIMEEVLMRLGIKAKTVVDVNDMRKYKHIYNIIIPKDDGEEPYSIDLQEDMIYMHYHAFPKNFGLSIDGGSYQVISREEQKKMHEKFGYISRTNPYVDEYAYLMKMYLPMFNDFYEQLDFVLKNIDPIPYPHVDYWERRWKHEKFLKEFFNDIEMGKNVQTLEFYRNLPDGSKKYINGFLVHLEKGQVVYCYSQEDNCYNSYRIPELAKKMKEEDMQCIQGISGLKEAQAKLKKVEKEK